MSEIVNTLNGVAVFHNEETERWGYGDGVDAWDTPRKCPKCDEYQTAEGHDACMGTLPGVKFACCGHGVSEGYICFDNDKVIRFPNSDMDVL